MEVARAASKASAALNAVSDLFELAIDEVPGFRENLTACRVETHKAKRTVDLIYKEKGLQTFGGVAGIEKLHTISGELDQHIVAFGKSQDIQALDQLSLRLRDDRRALCSQIRLAWPGLAKAADGNVVVDAKLLKKTNEAVKKTFGKDSGLHIATFLENKRCFADKEGKMHLTKAEYEDLSRSHVKIAHPEDKEIPSAMTTRIISNCLARDQSLQILGPVAEDMWKDINIIKIDGLVARDNATQFGYPVTMEVFQQVLNKS
ncbi:hypothetical protein ACHAQH_001168 [Verticillium albo-atrum]